MKKTPFGFEKITEVRIYFVFKLRLMEDKQKFLCVVLQRNKVMQKVLDGWEVYLNDFVINFIKKF